MADSSKPFHPDNETEIRRLEAALTAAAIGTWEFDPAADQLRICQRFKTIFGYPFDDIIPLTALLENISPDDRHLVRSQLEHGDTIDFECRVNKTLGGNEPWMQFRGSVDMHDNRRVVSGIISDITRLVQAVKRTEENASILRKTDENQKKVIARFRSLIEQAPVAICLFTGPDMIVEMANQPMVTYWGKDMSVIGKPLREAMPELDGQPFHQLLADILITKKAHVARDARVDIVVDGVLGTYYFDFTYKPLLDEQGEVYTIINISIDVTERVIAARALRESEHKLRSIVDNAPVAIGLFMGRDLTIEMPNQSFIDIVGKGPDITGRSLKDVMPELQNQPYLQILDDVFTTGKLFQSPGTQVDIVRNGELTQNFYNITYSPLFDDYGEVYAILDIAIDVTEKMQEQKSIEQSQMELLSLFEQAPVAVAVIRKENLTFTMANPFYAQLVGRSVQDLVGKPLLEALPEIEDQGFNTILENVIETGVPFVSLEQPVNLMREDGLQTFYVDLTYQPRTDATGEISGVLVVATDVTAQVHSRRQIQEAEDTLRGAVDLAELGTWQVDLQAGTIDISPRLRHWLGFEDKEEISFEKVLAAIADTDLDKIRDLPLESIDASPDTVYDVEFSTKASDKRLEKILHAQGQVHLNAHQIPYKVVGSVQDVTMQRKMLLSLEQQVQRRTEELESSNEELAAINEEYLTLNEDLSISNDLLSRSNENLQQFAYVASHDLQEPLRKIQSFGDLLKNRYAQSLGSGAEYVDRMQSSAKRMSALIDDLLSFSRVSSHINETQLVPLADVVASCLVDLEFSIHQSGAKVNVDELPHIMGDRLQLGQLFQNVVSNAIKFRKPDDSPVINIRSKTISSAHLPDGVKPARPADQYYQIDISDNGIGFDEKYTDRIFQIFQRLEGRSQYAGTGIGLAICQKVVLNHGGAITAHSRLGAGSTFQIFLPTD